MIAARCTPFGRSPLRRAVLICSSVHDPMPVSLSCVMFEAVTLNGGSSHDSPLERSRSKIGAPRSPFGVWQFWQVMIVLTRYLPRSTGACANAEDAVAASRTAPIITRTSMSLSRMPNRLRHPRGVARTDNGRNSLSTKRAAEATLFENLRLERSGRSRRVFRAARFDRSRVLAPRVDIAVDKLDHAHRRTVAMAIAGLEHAGIAAVA